MRAEPTSEKSGERMNVVASVREYVQDVRVEITKVSWPSRNELRDSTLVVIVMVFLVSIFIGVVDRGPTLAFEAIVKLAG